MDTLCGRFVRLVPDVKILSSATLELQRAACMFGFCLQHSGVAAWTGVVSWNLGGSGVAAWNVLV